MLVLSRAWAKRLSDQPETGMGYQICRVTLKDGRAFERVVIVEGMITKVGDSEQIPFAEGEIADIVVTVVR